LSDDDSKDRKRTEGEKGRQKGLRLDAEPEWDEMEQQLSLEYAFLLSSGAK